jgi:hypothetical protein
MRLYATFHGGILGKVFTTRAAAEAYPGPRGFEAAYKTVNVLISGVWEDANEFKPDHTESVLLQSVDGTYCLGRWDGKHWDSLFDESKIIFWHELPPAPMTQEEARAEEARRKAFD